MDDDCIDGPCSYCGHPDHWRPDCPVLAKVVVILGQELRSKVFSDMIANGEIRIVKQGPSVEGERDAERT